MRTLRLRSLLASAAVGILALFALPADGLVVIIHQPPVDHYLNADWKAYAGSTTNLVIVGGVPWYQYTVRGNLGFSRPDPVGQPFTIPAATIVIPDLQPAGSGRPLATATRNEDVNFLLDTLNRNLFTVRNAVYPLVSTPEPNPDDFPGNRAPIAANSTISYNGRDKLQISVPSLAADPDGDALTIKVVTKAKWGILVVQPLALQSQIAYFPFGAYGAGDSFTLEFSDGHGGVAQSTVTLENPFGQFIGSYVGTFARDGSFNATINRQGMGEFELQFGGERYSGSITFDESLAGVVSFTTGRGALFYARVKLTAEPKPALHVEFAEGYAPIVFDVPKVIAEEFVIDYLGQYNLVFVNNDGNKSFGYAIARVSPQGSVRLTGILSNGRSWSAGTSLLPGGKIPLQVNTRKGSPLLSGTLTLPPSSKQPGRFSVEQTVDAGRIIWNQPSRVTEMAAVGSPYQPVTVGRENMFGETTSTITLDIASPLFTSGNGLAATGRGLIYSNSVEFTVNKSNRATSLYYDSAKARLKLKPDGRFSGSYTEFDGNPTIPFRGIFYSGYNGMGVTTNGPGVVSIKR